jgi:hypothetical protein
MQNLDVHGTDQARADVERKPLTPIALELSDANEQLPRNAALALYQFVGCTTMQVGSAKTAPLRMRAADNVAASRPKKQTRASKRISMRQASNMMEAVDFAREIGIPLNAHATIHWVGTKAGDDPDGRRFAKAREGFDKWLRRNGHPDGLTAVCASDFRVVQLRWFTATCFST